MGATPKPNAAAVEEPYFTASVSTGKNEEQALADSKPASALRIHSWCTRLTAVPGRKNARQPAPLAPAFQKRIRCRKTSRNGLAGAPLYQIFSFKYAAS